MKRKGRHPDKALTAVQVRALQKPGRYADGNGLYLVVDPSGAKRWLLRVVVQGRRRDLGLGGLALTTLAEAREKALKFRKLAWEGGDPVAERRKAQVAIPTFKEASERVYTEHKGSWRNEKHAAQWISTLRTYAEPHLGDRRVDQIETPDVLRTLAPIWLTKPETARRVRQRIGTVLDWAKAAGHRSGDNPVEGVAKGLPKQTERPKHHAAMPYADVPAFIAALRASDAGSSAALAFEFLIHTASRTSEVTGARWVEIDWDARIWQVPAVRMKNGLVHRVPLTDRAVSMLRQAKDLANLSDFVFPGRVGGRPMSNMTFEMILRRMKCQFTTHGFRSSFRDWAAERTQYPREIAETALAHALKDKVEAAYRRSDFLNKRRDLMADWSTFLNPSAMPHLEDASRNTEVKGEHF